MIPENLKLSDLLNHYGQLLRLAGADRFRVRAYRNAARSVADAPVDVVAETRRGAVPSLPGVGPRIAAMIYRYVDDGDLPGLEDLEREYPPSLLPLLRLPRLNAKRIALLRQHLGIRTLEDLRRAASLHRLAGVKGLGARIEAEVLAALSVLPDGIPFRRADVASQVEEVAGVLRHLPGVVRVAAVGEWRRRRELLTRIEFLLAVGPGTRPEDLAVPLRVWAPVDEIGSGRLRLRRTGEIPIELAITDEPGWEESLLVETGSPAHLEELSRQPKRGGQEPARTESDLYRASGLSYIEPELREARGEIEAARIGRLPRLVQLEDLRGDLHSHTDRTDGRNTLLEMAEAAQGRGLTYLAITDHTQNLRITNGQNPARLREQIQDIDRLNARLRDFVVLKSAEVDILEDGSLDLPDDVLRELDLTVCSVHSKFGLPRDRQTERVLRAMEHPSFRILGHPTGRLLLRRQGYSLDLDRILRKARELGRILELNAQPDRLDLDDQGCLEAEKRGIKIAISSDAHDVRELGNLAWGVDQARRGWIEAGDVVNTMALAELRAHLSGSR